MTIAKCESIHPDICGKYILKNCMAMYYQKMLYYPSKYNAFIIFLSIQSSLEIEVNI